MGTNKETSVVNAHLKVHDIKGLRVIDSSVIPKLAGGQGVPPVVMIAEKAAEFIISNQT